MTNEEKYNFLLNNREQIDNIILIQKKHLIINCIRKINNNLIFQDWLMQDIPLFIAPLSKVSKGKLIHQPTEDDEEIYIDSAFFNNPENKSIVIHQLTHELLHSICSIRKRDEVTITQRFGHNWYDNNGIYLGIEEATTQMFTDDFEEYKLSKEQDPCFYFIKNIMRIMKIVIGEEKLLMQYLNYNTGFEDSFNNITNNKFNEFAESIYKIYNLSYIINNNRNNKDLSKEKEELEQFQKNILIITQEIINNQIQTNPNLQSLLEQEFNDNDFFTEFQKQLSNENGSLSNSIIYQKFITIREKILLIHQSIRNKRLQQINNHNKRGVIR